MPAIGTDAGSIYIVRIPCPDRIKTFWFEV